MKLLLISPPFGEKGQKSKGFPMSHITSWMIQFPQGRAFKEFAREKQRAGSRV